MKSNSVRTRVGRLFAVPALSAVILSIGTTSLACGGFMSGSNFRDAVKAAQYSCQACGRQLQGGTNCSAYSVANGYCTIQYRCSLPTR